MSMTAVMRAVAVGGKATVVELAEALAEVAAGAAAMVAVAAAVFVAVRLRCWRRRWSLPVAACTP